MRTPRIAGVVRLATAGLGSVSVARSDPTRANATSSPETTSVGTTAKIVSSAGRVRSPGSRTEFLIRHG